LAELRATLFYVGNPTADGNWHNLYAPPEGHRAILKHVNIWNFSGSAPYVSLGTSGQGVFTHRLGTFPGDTASWSWSGWLVVNEGGVISIQVTAGASIAVHLSGSIHYL